MLDYNALKPTDLSRLVDARIGNPDASGINLTHAVPAKNITWAYPIFTLDGDYGFAAASAVVGWHGAYWNGLNIVRGKKYKIKFSAVLNSGATPLAQISTGPVGSSGQLPYTHAITNGVNEYVVTATLTSSNAVVTIDANGVTSFSISGFEIQEWSGEELVSDPDVGFVGNDASKWTAYGTNTIAQDGNAVKITYVDNSLAGFILFRAASGTVFPANFNVGDKMKVTVRVKVNTGASVNLFIQDDGGGGTYHSPAQTNTEYEVVTLERTIAGNNFYIKT